MSAFKLGLTGSIGMGKSTAAAMFAAAGIPVWDADAAVHRIYLDGRAAFALKNDFPTAVHGKSVSRETLKMILTEDPSKFLQLEQLVHPIVANDRAEFLKNTPSDIVVLDIPLLFEKGTDADCDATLLITAPKDVQFARVLARPGMTQAQLELILARQMPDAEKRAKATHIVESLSIPSTEAYVRALIAHIRAGLG